MQISTLFICLLICYLICYERLKRYFIPYLFISFPLSGYYVGLKDWNFFNEQVFSVTFSLVSSVIVVLPSLPA